MRGQQFEDPTGLPVSLDDLADGGLLDTVPLGDVLHGFVVDDVRVDQVDPLARNEPLTVLPVHSSLEPFHVRKTFCFFVVVFFFRSVNQSD